MDLQGADSRCTVCGERQVANFTTKVLGDVAVKDRSRYFPVSASLSFRACLKTQWQRLDCGAPEYTKKHRTTFIQRNRLYAEESVDTELLEEPKVDWMIQFLHAAGFLPMQRQKKCLPEATAEEHQCGLGTLPQP